MSFMQVLPPTNVEITERERAAEQLKLSPLSSSLLDHEFGRFGCHPAFPYCLIQGYVQTREIRKHL